MGREREVTWLLPPVSAYWPDFSASLLGLLGQRNAAECNLTSRKKCNVLCMLEHVTTWTPAPAPHPFIFYFESGTTYPNKKPVMSSSPPCKAVSRQTRPQSCCIKNRIEVHVRFSVTSNVGRWLPVLAKRHWPDSAPVLSPTTALFLEAPGCNLGIKCRKVGRQTGSGKRPDGAPRRMVRTGSVFHSSQTPRRPQCFQPGCKKPHILAPPSTHHILPDTYTPPPTLYSTHRTCRAPKMCDPYL